MNEIIKAQLQFLGMKNTLENLDSLLTEAKKNQSSYFSFLTNIIEKEYAGRKERARNTRIKIAKIPELRVMETFPFSKQPCLRKKMVLEIYDSLSFLTERQELIFIGPTGCGKTGLATAFLIQAINQGYRGYFIEFEKLMHQFFQAKADHSEYLLLRQFQSYDILLIDELGYHISEKEQAGLFFELMKARNGKRTTIITTQLGFDEWDNFLQNPHLTAALIDRITTNCTVFNMKDCISIRAKKIVYATNKQEK